MSRRFLLFCLVFSVTSVLLASGSEDTLAVIEGAFGPPFDQQGLYWEVAADYAARFQLDDEGQVVQVRVVPRAWVREGLAFKRFEQALTQAEYEALLDRIGSVVPIGALVQVPTVVGMVTNSHFRSVEYREHAVVVRGQQSGRHKYWYFDILPFRLMTGIIEKVYGYSDIDSGAGWRVRISGDDYFVNTTAGLVEGVDTILEVAGPKLHLD